MMQCVALYDEGCDNRYFLSGQFCSKAVFLKYCFIAPSLRAIKFGDYWFILFDTNLVDTIFIAIQCEEATVTVKANMLEGLENIVGLKFSKS